MSDFFDNLKVVLDKLESQYGEVAILALFQRDDPLGLWDLIISASWLRHEDIDSFKTVCGIVQNTLADNELLKLSHVEILNSDQPIVIYLRDKYDVRDGNPEKILDCETLSDILGLNIKRAYLIRCLNNEDHPILEKEDYSSESF